MAKNQSLTTFQNTGVAITLSLSNSSSFCLNQLVTVTAHPAHGSLSGTSPNLIYTPAAGYTGQDSFQFAANGPCSASPHDCRPFSLLVSNG